MAVVGGLVAAVAAGDPSQAMEGSKHLSIAAGLTLKPAFEEIVPMFEREYGATVNVLYGPSQELRRQIENGVPIDVFLPSAAEEIRKLQKKGLTLNGGLRVYAQTSLVLVTSATSQATAVSFHDVLSERGTRVALGDPKSSALGEITATSLVKRDPGYKHRFNVIYAKHSDDVVNLVETGKADVGIVYRADAINNGRVWIVDETPTGTYQAVEFGQAVVWTCRESSRAVAEEFFDFISSPRIQKLLLKYGFDPVSVAE
jgi:molybdate transport system substrate-binding protein